MQIVIDIPKSLLDSILIYEAMYNAGHIKKYPDVDFEALSRLIFNGKPLPKGHGALKDVDKIGLTNFECVLCNGDYKEALKMLIDKIKNADTIIEADKEE